MSRTDQANLELPALEAVARIRAGALTSEELVAACLDRIEGTDATPTGWAEIDRKGALDRAREMDALRLHGLPLGALHGVPVAVDEGCGRIDMPAGHGPSDYSISDLPRGATPAVVERLLEAGAVIVGRTGSVHPFHGRRVSTFHPQDAQRTAGAPCGNAAVAVRSGHVPLAITCEANGGTMLSASYCGVFGFRPARGVISRRGADSLSPSLDQAGILGRTLEDVAVLADVLGGYDAADAASWPLPRPHMHDGARSTPPVEPDFIWLDMPYDDRLSQASRAGFEELSDILDTRIARFPAPEWFGRLPAAHRIIVEYETAAWWKARGEHSDTSLAELAELAERGFAHGEERYRAALASMEQARRYFSEFFDDYDAVVAPATVGESPRHRSGEDDDAIFCASWALCGQPVLCVPLLEGESGLPIGVQLIGSAHRDDRLLRTAGWLLRQVPGDTDTQDSDS